MRAIKVKQSYYSFTNSIKKANKNGEKQVQGVIVYVLCFFLLKQMHFRKH